MEKTLQEQLVELKSQLETSLTEKAKSEIALQIKSLEEKMKPVDLTEIKAEIKKVTDWQVTKDEADKKNQQL